MLTWKTKNVFPMAWSMRRVSSYRAAISAVNVRQGGRNGFSSQFLGTFASDKNP